MFKKKSGTGPDRCREQGDPKGDYEGNKNTLQIPGVIENADFFRSLPKKPVQSKSVPWQRRKHGIVKRQYHNHQKGCKKDEKVYMIKALYPIW